MFLILRGVGIYVFLLIVFRIAGKRTIAQITTFDFVLLLIISEVVQQAMIANDNSMLNASLLVIALVGLDIGLSIWKQHSKTVSKLVDSVPLVLIEDGKMMEDRMKKERVDAAEILTRAREHHGLESLDQIKYAILETSGGITIIPKEKAKKNQSEWIWLLLHYSTPRAFSTGCSIVHKYEYNHPIF